MRPQATPPAPQTTAPSQPNTQSPAATPAAQTTPARPWPPQTPPPPEPPQYQAAHPVSKAQSNVAFLGAPSPSERCSPNHGRSTIAPAHGPLAHSPEVPLRHPDRTDNPAETLAE